MLIPYAEASPYYVRRPTYFPVEKGGPYISFNSSLLPLSFTTLYCDSLGRWHFNNYWVTSTVDLTLQQWPLLIDRWINYSVSGAGTQEFYAVITFYQMKVSFDDVEQNSGFEWANDIITVTTTGSANVSVWFSPSGIGPPIQPPPQTEEPEPEPPYEIVPPEKIPEEFVGPEINPVLALCVFFAVVIVIVSAYHETPSLKSSRKKFKKKGKEKKKPKWKKEDPWEL